jgi:hypothetical protein
VIVARRSKARKAADSATHATEILALSPFVIGKRMAQMSRDTPLGAAMSLQGFAMEKGFAALESGTAMWMEMARQSVEASLGRHTSAHKSAEGIANAGLKPLSKRVRANHKSKKTK